MRGIVDGFENEEVRLECELDQVGKQVLGFPMAMISEAKLVLSDDLIRETLRRAKKLKEHGVAAVSDDNSTQGQG